MHNDKNGTRKPNKQSAYYDEVDFKKSYRPTKGKKKSKHNSKQRMFTDWDQL